MKNFVLNNRNYDPILNEEDDKTYEIDRKALFDNSAPRLPVILLVDVSKSMSFGHLYKGIKPIDEVNKGINQLFDYIKNDYTCAKRVELAVVTFNDEVKIVSDFAPIETKDPVHFSANRGTIMGPALAFVSQRIKERLNEYKQHGRSCYRPMVIMLTDGGPGDEKDFLREKALINEASKKKQLQFFAIKVGEEENKENNARHAALLNGIDYQVPVSGLDPKNFPDFFKWLSMSLRSRSSSHDMDDATIEDPSAWWKKLV